MTREEKVREANPYKQFEENGDRFEQGCSVGFNEGAEWADSHPNWHKFPEERPSKEHAGKKYYASCYDAYNKKYYSDCFEWSGREFGRYKDIPIYDRNHERVVAVQHEWEGYSPDVLAWIECPELPKFD